MKGFSNKRIVARVLCALLLGMILICPGIAHAGTPGTINQKAAAQTISVKFYGYNGLITTRSYTVGKTYSSLPTPPARTGYTFVGWYTSGTGGTRVYTSTKVSSSVKTLYARYQGKSSTVSFNSNGGSSVSSKTVYYSSQYGTLSTPSKTGYTFDGWYTKSSGGSKVTSSTTVTATSNHTLYAHWTAKKFTVYFSSQGGSSVQSKTVTYNSTYGSLSTPSRTGYTFDGWYTSASGGSKVTSSSKVTITSNQTLYAHWTAKEFTVSFNSNGGTSASSIKVKYDGTYGALPTTTRSGYVFQGWFTAIAGGTQITPSTKVTITSNQTLYAQWKAADCTITFDANGGYGQSNLTSLIVQQGTAIGSRLNTSPGAPTNKHFAGWFDAKAGGTKYTSTSKAPYQKTLTLYAHWEQDYYWITFNKNALNGVTGSMDNMTCLVGSSYHLTTNSYGRSGYKFKGWNTKADGSGVSYSNGAYISDLSKSNGATVTLYAQWEIAYCNITFDANGGSGQSNLTSLSVQQGATIGLRLATSPGAPANMHFAGWYSAKTGGTQYTITSKAPYTASLKLYARWEPNSYTILFNQNAPNGVTGSMSNMTCLVGSSYHLNSNKYIRTGYRFNGWNTKSNGTGTSYADGAYISDLSKTNGATVVLYATWIPNTFTVSFDSKGGSAVSKITVTYGNTYGKLPIPEKSGYTFDGWYTAENDGVLVTETTKVTKNSNHTLYAHWKDKTLKDFFEYDSRFVPANGIEVPKNSGVESAKESTANGYAAYRVIYDERSSMYNTKNLSDDEYMKDIKKRATLLYAGAFYGGYAGLEDAAAFLSHYFFGDGSLLEYDASNFMLDHTTGSAKYNSEVNQLMRRAEDCLQKGQTVTFKDKDGSDNSIAFPLDLKNLLGSDPNGYLAVNHGSYSLSGTCSFDGSVYRLDLYFYVHDFYDFYYRHRNDEIDPSTGELYDPNSQAQCDFAPFAPVTCDELAFLALFGQATPFETRGLFHTTIEWYKGQNADILSISKPLSSDPNAKATITRYSGPHGDILVY